MVPPNVSEKRVDKTGAERIQEENMPGGDRGWSEPGVRAFNGYALHFLLIELQSNRCQNVLY